MRIGLIFVLCVLAFPVLGDEVSWEKLKNNSNMIVLMRHAQASGGNALVWDERGKCKGELTLTGKGKDDAKKLGAWFAEHGIKPLVISSPMCRCRETAQLAFGEYVTDPDLRETASADAQQLGKFQVRAEVLLAKYRGEAPVVFISHRPNIDALTMELIGDGDMLIGNISEAGGIEVLVKIRLEP